MMQSSDKSRHIRFWISMTQLETFALLLWTLISKVSVSETLMQNDSMLRGNKYFLKLLYFLEPRFGSMIAVLTWISHSGTHICF